MKLININDNSEFTVKFRVPSRHARRRMNDAEIAHQQRYDEFMTTIPERYPLVDELRNSSVDSDRRRALNNDVDAIRQYSGFSEDLKDLIDYHRIEQFQAIIRDDDLSGEQQQLVQSRYDSEFWDMQDQEAIAEAVASFRRRSNGGQPANQGVSR